MDYGVCKVYGKASLFSRLLALLNRRTKWFQYSTIMHPLDWKEDE